MAKKVQEEQIHRDLFEKYLYLLHAGKNKTEALRTVAEQSGYSESALWVWKRNFNWDAREIIRSKEINEKTQQKNNETIVDKKVQMITELEEVKDKIIEAIQTGRIPIEKVSITELIRVMETILKIGGEDLDTIKGEFEVKEVGNKIPKDVAKEFAKLIIERSRSGELDTISE